MVATAEKKVRYFNKETNKIAWAYPDDLPEYARESVEAAPLAGRYADLIEDYLNQLRTAREDKRHMRAGDRAMSADIEMRIDQFGAAIDLAYEAERVTDEAANFACLDREFSFRVPPKVDGEYTTPTRRSQSRVYLATDPMEIAFLRRQVAKGKYIEIGLNERVAVPSNNSTPYIVDVKAWFNMLDRGQVNP